MIKPIIKNLILTSDKWVETKTQWVRTMTYNKNTGGSMWTKEQAADLDQRFGKVYQAIEDLETRTNVRFKALESRMDALETKINQILELLINKGNK